MAPITLASRCISGSSNGGRIGIETWVQTKILQLDFAGEASLVVPLPLAAGVGQLAGVVCCVHR